MFVEPAVAGELVYVGSCSGVYYAVDVHSGEVRWSHDLSLEGQPTTFHTNPVLVDDLIITGTDGASPGDIYAFDRITGEVRWTHLLAHGQVAADLLHVKGVLLALAKTGHLVALDARTGDELWTVAPANEPTRTAGSVLADGDTIFLGGRDEHVYAIRLADGAILWTRDLGSHVSTSLAKLGEHLFAGCENARLYRIAADSGEITASFETEEDPGGKLLAFPGTVVFLGHEPSTLVGALDTDLSELLWTAERRSWTTVRPVVWRDLLLLGDREGTLVALSPGDGEIVWTESLQGQLRGLGVFGDTIFIGTIEGKLYAYREAAPETSVSETPD